MNSWIFCGSSLVFLEGFALQAMQMEGLILRDVLHKGASESILALPMHDAVAVEFNGDQALEPPIHSCNNRLRIYVTVTLAVRCTQTDFDAFGGFVARTNRQP